MAHERKYGRVTTEFGNIPEDEPVVLFRAQDKLLPSLLEHYLGLCEQAGSPARHLDGINELIDEVEEWQSIHSSKVPDSERSREWMNK
jgi:hypothetical protein